MGVGRAELTRGRTWICAGRYGWRSIIVRSFPAEKSKLCELNVSEKGKGRNGKYARNGVRSRLEANDRVATVLVRLETSSAVVFWLLRRLSVVKTVRSLEGSDVRGRGS